MFGGRTAGRPSVSLAAFRESVDPGEKKSGLMVKNFLERFGWASEFRSAGLLEIDRWPPDYGLTNEAQLTN